MDPKTILNLPKEHQRAFILFLVLLVVVIILVDSEIGSTSLTEVVLGYLRAVAAAIITSLFVLWVIVSMLPQTRLRGAIVEIEPHNISKELEHLMATATRWRYKGNFGRYMRSKVVPEMEGRQNGHVTACILDPTDEDLCRRHARYREAINAVDRGRNYDSDVVALEAVTTIVICAWYVINRRVDIDLYLSPVFDPVRIDSNDEAMILTVEDRSKPALKVTRQHFSHEHFELQMEFARNQSRKLDLGGVREGHSLTEIEEEDVRGVLEHLALEQILERISANDVVHSCRHEGNPYGK